MKIDSHHLTIKSWLRGASPLASLQASITQACGDSVTPLRVAVVGKNSRGHLCEVEAVDHASKRKAAREKSIFTYRQRGQARTGAFNAVMLIPTGVDCAIGGHAGDATPAARLLASVCDNLVLHPNVVNASDINEQADNCLYTEGSLICRLMMGTIGLQKIRQNRVLLVTEERPDAPNVVDQTINCAEGARATLGMDISEAVVLKDGLLMKTGVSDSGRVTGHIGRLGGLIDLLQAKRHSYDAVALATKITPHIDTIELHKHYFSAGGANPWGGVEAVLTHWISTQLDVPSAHAPTMSSEALKTQSWGVVEPRKAAEIISTTYLFCVLKGLNRAPRVVVDPVVSYDPSLLTAEDLSALVIPDGCVGLPTLAALEQGIPVIAVRNNTNLMKNDLRELPFQPGQLLFVENYYEAAGMLAAMKTGVAPTALVRPMLPMHVFRTAEGSKKSAINGKASKPATNGQRTKRAVPVTSGASSNGHEVEALLKPEK